jgi:hypothetical protein
MSDEAPTVELDELYQAIESDRVTDKAVPFFDKYDEVARSILATIDSMQASGVHAPTLRQARALRNIYLGACYWLGRTPTPSKIDADPDYRRLGLEHLPKG